MVSEPILRRTALFDAHRALGAKIVPFGGFEMPVQYDSILAEHDAVRKRAGLFDLSHMAQFELRGENVGAWADSLTVNNVATMKPLQARYNIFCNENGGAHDDVIFYRLPDRWLLVVNAGNADKMWAHINAHRAGDVTLTNYHGERALIAIQGPRSVEILQEFVDVELAAMKYYTCAEAQIGGVRGVIARTGYTGEDGFELFVEGDAATALWDAILAAGRAHGLEPAGLGARDVLRLEAGMPLYGHEMTEEIGPIQAGLGWAVKLTKPTFRGRAALEAQQADATLPKIVGLVLEGRVPARAGYRVFCGGSDIGEIRSGSFGPSVGKNIATGLLAPGAATIGSKVSVEIRGTRHDATVVELPFYKRPKV